MSIGGKILSLVSAILVIMSIPSAFSAWQMSQVAADLSAIVERDIPLREAINTISRQSLEQSVTAQRAMRFAGATLFAAEAEQAYADAKTRYGQLSTEIQSEFDKVETALNDRVIAADIEKANANTLLERYTDFRSAHLAFDSLVERTFKYADEGRSIELADAEKQLDAQLASLTASSQRLRAAVDDIANATAERSVQKQRTATTFITIATLIAFPFAFGIGAFLTRSITSPLQAAVETVERVAAGNTHIDVAVGGRDETGKLLQAMRSLVANFREIVSQANVIAGGDYTAEVAPRGPDDELGHALHQMTGALRDVSDQNRRDRWLRTGQNEVAALLRGEHNDYELAEAVLKWMVRYIDAHVGVAWLSDGTELHQVASYAFTHRKSMQNRLKHGEGLVGQAALERQPIVLHNVPDDYIQVSSGLGETAPRSVIVQPLIAGDELIGAVEIASLTILTPAQIELMQSVSESVAIALRASHNRACLELLVEETKQQSDALEQRARVLKESQEELQATNEELAQQTQMLRQSEEELQEANEEMEAKAEHLARKNVEVEAAKRALERQTDELQRASAYKSEFLANMSHELRTPLNSLLILAKSLADNPDGNLTEHQATSAGIIHRGGKELLNLINDVLDLSKVEAGKLDITWGALDFERLIEALRGQFDPLLAEKGVDLICELDASIDRPLRTDGRRVEQILRNLLGNATKFTRDGQIRLSISVDDEALGGAGAVKLQVTDTGIGIAIDRQRAIWEAFQQADGSTSRSYGGTGLGLSISRDMATLLHGEIRLLHSHPGLGSTFALYLPLDPDRSASALARKKTERPQLTANAPVAPEPQSLRLVDTKTVLIIEDDPLFVDILTARAKEHGYHCLTSSSGADGIQLARAHHPTAIILDVGLPDIGGVNVLEQLKFDLRTRHIPVHVVSAGDRGAVARQKGAIGFLSKPATEADLDDIFDGFEAMSRSRIKRLLVVEDDVSSAYAVRELVSHDAIEVAVQTLGQDALAAIKDESWDCMILDLNLPDMTGFDLLRIAAERALTLPPTIIYTGRSLTREEHNELSAHSRSIVVKGVASPDRLLDEASLFLHSVDAHLPPDQRDVIRQLHDPDVVLRGRRVLVVDDDLRNTFALAGVLRQSGLEVEVADNGRFALEKLQTEGPFDLVIMDIMMPEMDGIEATRRLRSLEGMSELPVIALTAKAMPEDRAHCLEAGASDFMTKPVDTDQLLSLLRVWLFSGTAEAVEG